MATVKELKRYLDNLSEDETLYVGYDEDNELSCEIFTEEDIIDKANEIYVIKAEENYDNDEGTEDEFTDINDALSYLADMDADYHYMELEV